MNKYKVGMIGGSYNPLHNGHVKCIMNASSMCEELHIIVGDLPNRDIADINTKMKWMKEVFKDNSNIYFHILKDETEDKKDYNQEKWIVDSLKIKKMIEKPIDIVFCGDDYNREDNPYKVCYPNSYIHFFSRDDNISSSRFKENPKEYKEDVPEIVYEFFNKNN